LEGFLVSVRFSSQFYLLFLHVPAGKAKAMCQLWGDLMQEKLQVNVCTYDTIISCLPELEEPRNL
jgi:hypothetical protein